MAAAARASTPVSSLAAVDHTKKWNPDEVCNFSVLPIEVITYLAQSVFAANSGTWHWQSSLPENPQTGVYLVATGDDKVKKIEARRTIYVVRTIPQKANHFIFPACNYALFTATAFHFSATHKASLRELDAEIVYNEFFSKNVKLFLEQIDNSTSIKVPPTAKMISDYKALQSKLHLRRIESAEEYYWQFLPLETINLLAIKYFGNDIANWCFTRHLAQQPKKGGVYLFVQEANDQNNVRPAVIVSVVQKIPRDVNQFFNRSVNYSTYSISDFTFSFTKKESHELAAAISHYEVFAKMVASLEESVASSTHKKPTPKQIEAPQVADAGQQQALAEEAIAATEAAMKFAAAEAAALAGKPFVAIARNEIVNPLEKPIAASANAKPTAEQIKAYQALQKALQFPKEDSDSTSQVPGAAAAGAGEDEAIAATEAAMKAAAVDAAEEVVKAYRAVQTFQEDFNASSRISGAAAAGAGAGAIAVTQTAMKAADDAQP